MSKVISCVVPTSTKAQEVVSRLQSAGIPHQDISVLFGDSAKQPVALEKNTKAPEGAVAGGGTGGILGGVLGLLAGIGSLSIPGLGIFIAAGPIMGALSGTAVGAAVGGLIGSLVGLGIPEIEAKQYEEKLKKGYALVSCHSDDDETIKKAKEIFKDSSVENISETKTLAA